MFWISLKEAEDEIDEIEGLSALPGIGKLYSRSKLFKNNFTIPWDVHHSLQPHMVQLRLPLPAKLPQFNVRAYKPSWNVAFVEYTTCRYVARPQSDKPDSIESVPDLCQLFINKNNRWKHTLRTIPVNTQGANPPHEKTNE
jgi:hypothetical protein